MTRFPTVLFSRSLIIFWYSGDLYHPSAASRDGNSIITSRGCGHSPSNNFKSPPRTMNLPPKASIVAGTAFRYSANMASSLAVSVAITNAFIIFSLIGQFQMRQIQGKYWTGVSFVNYGSIDSSNKITDFRSRVPHTLARGTFGTELPRGGVSLRRGPDGLRRGVDRRFALARRGSPNFSCRGVTGPSG